MRVLHVFSVGLVTLICLITLTSCAKAEVPVSPATPAAPQNKTLNPNDEEQGKKPEKPVENEKIKKPDPKFEKTDPQKKNKPVPITPKSADTDTNNEKLKTKKPSISVKIDNSEPMKVEPQNPVKVTLEQPVEVKMAEPKGEKESFIILSGSKNANKSEEWVRLIAIPILLWLLMKVILFNFHRFQLINAISIDLKKQIYDQLLLLSKIENWVTNNGDIHEPISYEYENNETYKSFLLKISYYLTHTETKNVLSFYNKLMSIQETLKNALSFHVVKNKATNNSNNVIFDIDRPNYTESQSLVFSSIESSFQESRSDILSYLKQFFDDKDFTSLSIRDLLSLLNQSPELIPAIVKANFFNSSFWNLVGLAYPLSSITLKLYILFALNSNIMINICLLVTVVVDYYIFIQLIQAKKSPVKGT